MYNLDLLSETYTNGLRVEFLDIISLLAIISGALVITSKNPIVSVYLLVYVGAVSILFLFILMLINVRISELLSNTNKSIPLAILIIISIICVVNSILPFYVTSFNSYIFDNDVIYFATSKL